MARPTDTSRLLKETKLSSAKTPVIDPDAKIRRIEAPPADGEVKCVCCGKVYKKQDGNFLSTASIMYAGNNGFVPFCKSCLQKYFDQLVEYFSGNEEKALDKICMLCDWYFCDEAAMMTRKSSYSRVFLYPSKANLPQIKAKGTTYLDTIRDRATVKIAPTATDGESADAEVNPDAVPAATYEFFGHGFDPQHYKFLQAQYDDWTSRYECSTKAQEEIFKQLCIAQLNINIAQRTGNPKAVADAQKALQDLLGSGNLKPAQNTDNALADQNTFGTLIQKLENEEPVMEPAPEWQDVDGIRKYISTWFLGHMCKLLHLKNDAATEYEKEIAEYTVTKPQYNEDSEDCPTTIFDKYTSKKPRKNPEDR